MLKKLKSDDWVSIIGFCGSMGVSYFLGMPLWAAFGLGVIGSILLGVAWTVMVHRKDLAATYKKALQDCDREHGDRE